MDRWIAASGYDALYEIFLEDRRRATQSSGRRDAGTGTAQTRPDRGGTQDRRS